MVYIFYILFIFLVIVLGMICFKILKFLIFLIVFFIWMCIEVICFVLFFLFGFNWFLYFMNGGIFNEVFFEINKFWILNFLLVIMEFFGLSKFSILDDIIICLLFVWFLNKLEIKVVVFCGEIFISFFVVLWDL